MNRCGKQEEPLTMKEWQALGFDQNSLVANPGFKDPKSGDFALADDSPALALGFIPIDLSDLGPRSEDERP